MAEKFVANRIDYRRHNRLNFYFTHTRTGTIARTWPTNDINILDLKTLKFSVLMAIFFKMRNGISTHDISILKQFFKKKKNNFIWIFFIKWSNWFDLCQNILMFHSGKPFSTNNFSDENVTFFSFSVGCYGHNLDEISDMEFLFIPWSVNVLAYKCKIIFFSSDSQNAHKNSKFFVFIYFDQNHKIMTQTIGTFSS